jgi:hypothetical protein
MSSVGSFQAQIPKGGDAFIAYQTSGANMLLEANLPTSASTGYQSGVGSSYVFNTVTNANTAITASASPIVEGDTFQSLGKKLYFYVNGSVGGVPMIYAVLEKVREVSDLATAGGLYEGGDGQVGYVVTYSAAPGTTPVSVVRTGRNNGGI